MKLDLVEIQDGQYEEYADNEMLYTDRGKGKRKKKRRRNMIYTILGLTGCLILMVAVMYVGMMIWERVAAEDAMSDTRAIYTQEELDEKLQEAQTVIQNQVGNAADAREKEILDSIKQQLNSGLSVVETLRNLYPDELVLVSGGKYHFVPIDNTLKHNDFSESNLNFLENGEIQYLQNGQVVSYKGIDVSKHQGEIDWQKVAEDGVEFAFIRVALRGYGTGKLVADEKFEDNIKGALGAGVKVGVYIYSQAITEEELQEEADFVLQQIAPYKIECPVVFDVEMVSGDDGRMNSLTVEERTKLTALFCERIKNAGYRPMIYHNMEMGALRINLKELEDYDKWFAYYNPNFYYPYEYDVWQYSDKGRINGIKGNVDLNISFVPLWE